MRRVSFTFAWRAPGGFWCIMGMEKMKTAAGRYERKDNNEEGFLHPHGRVVADDKRVERLRQTAF